MKANDESLQRFCEPAIEKILLINKLFYALIYVLIFNGLGYLTGVIQKLTIIQMKDNIDISPWRIFLEISIVFSSAYTFQAAVSRPQNNLITNQCTRVMEIDPVDIEKVSFIYSLVSQTGLAISMNMQLSL